MQSIEAKGWEGAFSGVRRGFKAAAKRVAMRSPADRTKKAVLFFKKSDTRHI